MKIFGYQPPQSPSPSLSNWSAAQKATFALAVAALLVSSSFVALNLSNSGSNPLTPFWQVYTDDAGNYFGKAPNGTICWTSTDGSTVTQNVVNNCPFGGMVDIGIGNFTGANNVTVSTPGISIIGSSIVSNDSSTSLIANNGTVLEFNVKVKAQRCSIQNLMIQAQEPLTLTYRAQWCDFVNAAFISNSTNLPAIEIYGNACDVASSWNVPFQDTWTHCLAISNGQEVVDFNNNQDTMTNLYFKNCGVISSISTLLHFHGAFESVGFTDGIIYPLATSGTQTCIKLDSSQTWLNNFYADRVTWQFLTPNIVNVIDLSSTNTNQATMDISNGIWDSNSPLNFVVGGATLNQDLRQITFEGNQFLSTITTLPFNEASVNSSQIFWRNNVYMYSNPSVIAHGSYTSAQFNANILQ